MVEQRKGENKRQHNTIRDSSMVEQLPVKELVPGSSPGRGAVVKKSQVSTWLFF
jgi:hypothetical protein